MLPRGDSEKARLDEVGIALMLTCASFPLSSAGSLFSGTFLGALKRTTGFPSSSTLRDERLPRGFRLFMNHVKGVLRDLPFVLVVDESQERLRRGVLSVVCRTYEKTLTLKVVVTPECANSDSIVDLVEVVLSEYSLRRELFVGLCGDNASYMVLAAEKLHVSYIRCLAHGLNLLAQTFGRFFKRVNSLVTELNMFFKVGCSFSRRTRLTEATDVTLSEIDVAPTRWNSWLGAVYHIEEHWTDLKEFVGGEEAESGRKAVLLELFDDEEVHAATTVIQRATKLLHRLTVEAQGEGFAQRQLKDLDTLRVLLHHYARKDFSAREDFPDICESCSLSDDAVAQLSSVLSGCCKACISKWGNLDPTIGLLKRRVLFDPTSSHEKLLTPADVGGAVDSELQAEWGRFTEESRRNPCETGEFWRKNREVFPSLFGLFKKWRTVPSSSASVERTFSLMRDSQDSRRSSMSPDYLSMEMLLRSNREEVLRFVSAMLTDTTEKTLAE